jgi:hypothetical protein
MDSGHLELTNLDWVEIGNNPHLQEFFVRNTLRAVKTNIRPWDAFDVVLLRPDNAGLAIPRSWGWGFTVEQAALCSLYALGIELVPNETLVQFLGEQIMNNLLTAIEKARQDFERKDILQVSE